MQYGLIGAVKIPISQTLESPNEGADFGGVRVTCGSQGVGPLSRAAEPLLVAVRLHLDLAAALDLAPVAYLGPLGCRAPVAR